MKPKYTGSLQEPPKKDYFVQKGHKNVIKVQRKHKTMYKLKGNLQTLGGESLDVSSQVQDQSNKVPTKKAKN